MKWINFNLGAHTLILMMFFSYSCASYRTVGPLSRDITHFNSPISDNAVNSTCFKIVNQGSLYADAVFGQIVSKDVLVDSVSWISEEIIQNNMDQCYAVLAPNYNNKGLQKLNKQDFVSGADTVVLRGNCDGSELHKEILPKSKNSDEKILLRVLPFLVLGLTVVLVIVTFKGHFGSGM